MTGNRYIVCMHAHLKFSIMMTVHTKLSIEKGILYSVHLTISCPVFTSGHYRRRVGVHIGIRGVQEHYTNEEVNINSFTRCFMFAYITHPIVLFLGLPTVHAVVGQYNPQ